MLMVLESGACNKTSLGHRADVSSRISGKFVDNILSDNLAYRDPSHNLRLSRKGVEYLYAYRQLRALLQTESLEEFDNYDVIK